MSSKVLEKTDYRFGLGDKYGRRKCSRCGKLRRINAYWKDRNYVLCKECSVEPGIAFGASVRGGKLNIKL